MVYRLKFILKMVKTIEVLLNQVVVYDLRKILRKWVVQKDSQIAEI